MRRIITARAVSADALTGLRTRLPSLWSSFTGVAGHAFTVTLTQVGADLDRQWIVEALTSEPLIRSVIFDLPRATTGQWNWPLQIGLPPTPAGRQLHSELLEGRYRELYDPVILGEDAISVDLLLVPGSLSGIAKTYPRGTISADAVITLGGAELEAKQTTAKLRSLMGDYSAGMSGVCLVPRAERMSWAMTLIRELSHN